MMRGGVASRHDAWRYRWPCSPWPVGPAHGPRPGILARPGHGMARQLPGRAWAVTVARGTAQAWPDGPMFNVPVKNIAF